MNSAYRFSWLLWIGGTALILGSWNGAVTPQVGWVGFGVALAGTLLSMVSNRVSPAADPRESTSHLCGSCLLHQSDDCRRPERPHAVTCPEYMKV
jgi:hypothetical protein